jgi:hypothetical protein
MYLDLFLFTSNPGEMELTDRSKGRIVFADAVKWVKR